MNETLKLVLVGVMALVFSLAFLSRRFPEVGWLKHFRLPEHQRSPEQARRAARRADTNAGVKLIMLGLALPFGYAVLTVMTFNSFRPGPTLLVGAGSAACLVLGALAIRSARRR